MRRGPTHERSQRASHFSSSPCSRSATFHAPPPARRRTGAISRAPRRHLSTPAAASAAAAAASPAAAALPPSGVPRRGAGICLEEGAVAAAAHAAQLRPPSARCCRQHTLTASAIVVNEATHFHPRGVSFIRLSNGHRAPQVLYPPPHTSQAPSLPRLQTLWQQPARGLGWS